MPKTNLTKANQTAYSAAEKLLAEREQKEIKIANDKLSDLIKSWEFETGCTFVIGGRFHGNQVNAGLIVIKMPKK